MAGHIGGKPENFPCPSSPVRFGPTPQEPPAQWLFFLFSSKSSPHKQSLDLKREESKASLFLFFSECGEQRSG